MKNNLLKIFIALFLVLNLVLLLTGIILQNNRKERLEMLMYDTVTSSEFVQYTTDGEYQNWDLYKESFDNDPNDEGIINDERENFHEQFFSKWLNFDDLENVLEAFGTSLNNPMLNPESALKIINLEKRETKVKTITLYTLVGKSANKALFPTIDLVIEFENGIENGLSLYILLPTLILGTIEGVLNSIFNLSIEIPNRIYISTILDLLNNILQSLLINSSNGELIFIINKVETLISIIGDSFLFNGIDIFRYEEKFVINDVEIDLTDGIDIEKTKAKQHTDEYNAFMEMDNFQKRQFASTFEASLQLATNGNETMSLRTSQYLNYFGGNELYVWNTFAKRLSKQSENHELRYSTIEFKDGIITPKFKYSFNNNEKSFKKIKMESLWEQFLWLEYNELNYSKYFDNALTSDNLDKFTLTYYFSKLNNIEENEVIFSPEFESLNSDITNVLWTKGDHETSFSNFVLLSNLYRPFLRTNNIDNYLKEISKLMTENVKLSDLQKPSKV